MCRWRTLALALLLAACLDDPPLALPTTSSAQLALAARLVGLSTTADYRLRVQVVYLRAGGDEVPLRVMPGVLELQSGRSTRDVTVDLDPCVADATTRTQLGCRIRIELQLLDAGDVVVASDRQSPPDPVEPGARIANLPEFRIAPPRLLTIQGGGPGTGSGAVTVPAAGDRAALRCAITDGVAAPTGCTGSYPYGLELTLTAEGELSTWGGACTDAGAACAVTMDEPREVTATFAAVATTGALLVELAGLPSELNATLTATGPDAVPRPLTPGQRLTGLPPGDYTVTAPDVAAPDQLYRSTIAPAPTVQVAVGSLTSVTVTYAPTLGALLVNATGLPSGTSPDLTLAEPGADPRPVTPGEPITGLAPGDYTVLAAEVVGGDGLTYTPAPLSQTVEVTAGQTTEAAVAYTGPTTGGLVITIDGLPDGVAAAVVVSGPSLDQQQVTATTPLSGLAPGTYSITAAAVTVEADGQILQLYQPSELEASARVDLGQIAQHTVTYTPTLGALTVAVSGLPAEQAATVTIAAGDFSRTVSVIGSVTLTGLPAGSHTVTAGDVEAGGQRYIPDLPEQAVSIAPNQPARVGVSYRLGTGDLTVAITGLPRGVEADVDIRPPTGAVRPVKRTETITGLTPGTYAVEARNVDVADPSQTFVPDPATQPAAVAPGRTTVASVVYRQLPPESIEQVSGDGQSCPAGLGRFDCKFLVKVTNSTGHPVSGADVLWTMPEETRCQWNPSNPFRMQTDANGSALASNMCSFTSPGTFTQTATVAASGKSVTFTFQLVAVEPAPGAIKVTVATSGSPLDPDGYLVGRDYQCPEGGDCGFGETFELPVNGTGTFSKVAPGKHSVRLEGVAENCAVAPEVEQSVGVESDATTEIGFTVSCVTPSTPPTITSIEDFPPTVSNGPGRTAQATIRFIDPNGDVARLLVSEISDPNNVYSPTNFELDVSGQGEGSFSVNLWACTGAQGCFTGPVSLSLSLQDAAGNVGEATVVSFEVAGGTPTITAFRGPPFADNAPGTVTPYEFDFADPDGDVVEVAVTEVSDPNNAFSGSFAFDPRASGRTSGTIRATFVCRNQTLRCASGTVTFDYTLKDFAGHVSPPFRYVISFGELIPIQTGPDAVARGSTRAPAQQPASEPAERLP